MNAERFLELYEKVADAPDAAACLRRFALDLAVRGMLVSQLVSDEPAAELLKRIVRERRLPTEIERPKGVKDHLNGEEEQPFCLPPSWAWSRLGIVAQFGLRDKVDSNKQISEATWVLDLEDIEKETSRLIERVPSSARPFCSSKTVFQRGDVLFGKLRPYLNKVLVADEDGVCTTEIVPVRGSAGLVPEFVRIVLKSPMTMGRIERLMYGMKMPRLGTGDGCMLPFPLPPLLEQHRIVAKVDELMALCDKLEASRKEREATRDTFTVATLGRLDEPDRDPGLFLKDTRFAIDHASTLTQRRDQIKQIRQTILNLAVRGKLVPQDPNDEPACGALTRIQEKKRQRAQPRSSDFQNAEAVPSGEESAALPSGWWWSTLGALSFEMRYGTSKRCGYSQDGVPVLRIPNVSNGRIDIEDLKRGPLNEREVEDLKLECGDLLIIRSNGSLNLVGRVAIVEECAAGMAFAGYLVRVRLSSGNVDSRFILLAMNSSDVRDQIEKPIRSTVGLKNINSSEISAIRIPIPPLSEQEAIVVKVAELNAMCERLEGALSIRDDVQVRLIESLLSRALGTEKEVAVNDREEAAVYG
jgi:type I restriction enzyme S subunit